MLAVILVAAAPSAEAGDGWGNVVCGQRATTGCTTSAGTTGKAAGHDHKASPSARKAASAKARVCTDIIGMMIPCSDPFFGDVGADHCYYKATAVTPRQAVAFGGAGNGPGGWFEQVCMGIPGTAGGLVWRPARAGGPVVAPPSPKVLARQAVDRLDLSTPVIGANPSPQVQQLVSLPTWLWVQPASWQPQTATAAVPGVSVTATATPTTVTWTMGDRSKVVCDGPGTPFPSGGDPRAPSPDCGHTYTKSSVGLPDSAFAVKATVSWEITWEGDGQQGDLPALQTESQTQFRVAESQALVSGGGPARYDG